MKEKYLGNVLKCLKTDRKTKQRIREDLSITLDVADDLITYDELVTHFGNPEEMAQEFMDNLEFPETYYGITVGLSRRAKPYQFTSKKSIFGIPLLHINISGRYGVAKAKGIIAIGDISLGIISIGGIATGLISIGGLSVGLLSFGGIAAGILSLGGISAGYIAVGGIAFAIFKAFGEVTRMSAFGLIHYISGFFNY